ncbi:MAG: sugar ABC transporter substrate-binding protein [Bifidobacteriaceae bacterium]|jgi:multiple sugar transport system substrate-binding protein|nr:sugar ABC transporter substrate-binding protein [Bifidobacteriaceae bacterium]
MKANRMFAAFAGIALMASLGACAGDSTDEEAATETESGTSEPGDEGLSSGVTISYWATNQGPSVPFDEEVLNEQIARFTEETGIEVDLEVVPWSEINDQIVTATTTMRGPDVLNFGNTNAYRYGSTGALLPFTEEDLAAVGGRDKFIPAAFSTTDLDPITSLPLYSQVYGLFYNKKLYADAGLEPPTTWNEYVEQLEQLTDPSNNVYGLAYPGANNSMLMHFLFIYGRQHGVLPFDDDANATLNTDGMAETALQLIDLYQKGVVSPGSYESTEGGDAMNDFLQGKVATVIQQNGAVINGIADSGLSTDDFGVVPLPLIDPLSAGGEPIQSMIAGTNISVFANTEHKAESLAFVQFMTDNDTLATLDAAYGVLPVIEGAGLDFMPDEEWAATFIDILSNRSQALPIMGDNNAFQTNAGGEISRLIGQSATSGSPITLDQVKEALNAAQDMMPKK